MANETNVSTLYDSYEYYLDYLDLIPVDERKLKANKFPLSWISDSVKQIRELHLSVLCRDLIVIAFWVSLALFVMLLFLILLYMSWSGSSPVRNNAQHHPICPWSHSLHLPLCIRRHPPGSMELGRGTREQSIQP